MGKHEKDPDGVPEMVERFIARIRSQVSRYYKGHFYITYDRYTDTVIVSTGAEGKGIRIVEDNIISRLLVGVYPDRVAVRFVQTLKNAVLSSFLTELGLQI